MNFDLLEAASGLKKIELTSPGVIFSQCVKSVIIKSDIFVTCFDLKECAV